MDTSRERLCDCWYAQVCDMPNPCNMCIRYIEMSYLMENSNLPKNKQKAIKLGIPDCDRGAYQTLLDIKSDIFNFVDQGENLYIGSNYTGNGKTSWAIKLMHAYFNAVWDGNGLRERALFINVPTFLMKCKEFGVKDEEFQKIKQLLLSVDLVVWDDIASTDMSSYDYSQIFPYIDSRLLEGRSNIYTGNFDNKSDLLDKLGDRLASRVWSHNTHIVIFNSRDMR